MALYSLFLGPWQKFLLRTTFSSWCLSLPPMPSYIFPLPTPARTTLMSRLCCSLLVLFYSSSVTSCIGSPSSTRTWFSNLHVQESSYHHQQSSAETLCISMLLHPLPYETSNTIFLALVMLSCSWVFVYAGPPPGNVLSPLASLAGLWLAIRSRVPWSHLSPESRCGAAPMHAFFASPIRSFAALCCPSPPGVVRLISF